MNQRREAILNHPALLPVAGNYDRKPRSLDRDVTTIGRARGSDLCLEANEISTLHCIIYRTPEGYRVRDCNSRTGTRVNGESCKSHALRDGDIINLGPFSFELRIPVTLFPKDGAKVDPARIEHWKNSRRKLAQFALKMRERLHHSDHGALARERELEHKAHQLKEKIRAYDGRSRELEEAERELDEERETLLKDKESHSAHVQHVERTMAEQLKETDQAIRDRWQEFQQRCKLEEARLQQLTSAATASAAAGDATVEPSAQQTALAQLQVDLQAQQTRVRDLEEQLSHRKQELEREHQEFLTMKEQWVEDQSHSTKTLEEQRASLAQQESALRTQKAELLRMMGNLKKMQEDLRKQAKGDDLRELREENERLQREKAELQTKIEGQLKENEVQTILEENDKLRELVRQLEQRPEPAPVPGLSHEDARQLDDLRAEVELLREYVQTKEAEIAALHKNPKAGQAGTGLDKDLQNLRAENDLLKKLLQEKEEFVDEVNKKAHEKPKSENDLERYETELNDYRRQLDADRAKLNKEVELLRERNRELDEALREMEMEMSKERAELARERIRLERVRDEIKADMERMQREIAVRDSMAPVQKLRDEINGKQPVPVGKGEKALNDRLRGFRNQLTDNHPS